MGDENLPARPLLSQQAQKYPGKDGQEGQEGQGFSKDTSCREPQATGYCLTDPPASGAYAPASVLREMLTGLLFGWFISEVAALQALYSHIGRGEQGAEGLCKHRIGLERI